MNIKSIKDKDNINLKESFKALKFLPRFFVEIKTASPIMFWTNLLARVTNAFAPVVTLWMAKMIIDEIISITKDSHGDYNRLWFYVGIELGIVIVSDLINRGITLTDGLLGDLYSNYSSVTIIRKTKELSISILEDSSFYDKLERARTQTSRRVALMSTTLSQFQDLIVIASLIVGLVVFEPWLILLLILSIIPSFLNEIKFSGSRYSLARSWTSERRELDYLRYIGANYRTAKEMKLFGLIDYIADKFYTLSDQYYHANKELAIKRTFYGALFNLLGVLSYYAAYVLIIWRVIQGILTIGQLTFLSGAFSRLKNRLQASFNRFTRISESALYLKDYFDYLDMKVDRNLKSGLSFPKVIKEGIRFEEVRFQYPESEKEVLKGVNFILKAGEKMAFVGENGAGKTTLIKLLMRFYEPTSGRILLDGVDIKAFNLEEWQHNFGVIFQDFIRYEFTLGENIGIGKVEAIHDIQQIKRASELSLAVDVVQEMKEGYQQQLGKRFNKGAELSGGQWQKIALARAYMNDATFMILDEPTSALDARAEYEAFQRFMGLTQGKTSIIISHRFSTVRMADRIIVLKGGKILEKGTHEELISNGGLYQELFQLQAEGYQ